MESIRKVPAEEIEFEEFCVLLKQLQKKKRQEQDTILTNFFNDIRIKIAKVTDEKDSSLLSILRLLLPHRDRIRNPYKLKEKRLGEVLVKVLSLPKQTQDAQKLLNFRSISNTSNEGDFAAVAYFVLKNRVSQKSSSLTIRNINEILDQIAPAEGNKINLDGALSYAFKRLTIDQLLWFLRIILKDLKLGMSEHRILAAFHLDAPEFFDNCADLQKVCEEFGDCNSRPLELGIQLFYAVNPMLSERLNITQIFKISPNKSYLIEQKFDGERFQMHMEDGVFEYFSRKGHRFGDNYGRTYESGLLTPFMKGCFSENVKSIILDGEMMGWNKEHKYFGSKGMAFDVKKITERSKFQPCFCVFDILYYNGRSVVGPPEKGGLTLLERVMLLDAAFTAVPGVIQHSVRKPVKEIVDVLNALNDAIENQDEGIVMKNVESYYIANKRNAGWYKIKPEYTEGTMTDLDLVVIGADEAENKRQGRAKSFHVACLDDAPGEARRWVSVGRVCSGVSHAEREALCGALEPHWTRTARAAPPPALRFGRHRPDLWLLPERSVVLEVRATELVRSADAGAGYTLRFPRIVRVRTDKPVADVITLQEFNQLASSNASVVKLSSKRVSADQIGDHSSDIKILRKRSANVQVGAQFRTRAEGAVQVTSQALLGRKICILSDDVDCSKADLIKIVESHGGIHVQNIGEDTWCSVAGRLTERVRHMLRQRVDVASAAWLRALPPGAPPPRAAPPAPPACLLAAAPRTALALRRRYDRYGDPHAERTDCAALRDCFQRMDNTEPPIYLTKREMLEVDEILFGGNNHFSFLRPCTVTVKKPYYAVTARMYGASVGELSAATTHAVVANDTDAQEIEEIRRRTHALVLSENWLEACFSEKTLVPHTPYLLIV